MKTTPSPQSPFQRGIVLTLVALLGGLILWFVAENNRLQIAWIGGALMTLLLLVLATAAWRYGVRWFITRSALRFYLWLLFGLVSVVVLYYSFEGWRGKRAWAALQLETAARGESLALASVIPPTIPDEENFALAPGVAKVLGYETSLTGTPLKPRPRTPVTFYHGEPDGHNKFSRWPTASWALHQFTDLAAWQTFFRQHPNTATPPEDTTRPQFNFSVAPEPQSPAADVLLALSRFDQALGVLRTASQRPKSRYPLNYTEGWFAKRGWEARDPELRSAVHLLCLRASAKLDQQQSAAALDDVLFALHLADTTKDEPFADSHLYGRSEMLMFCLQPVWESLAKHYWTEPQLHSLTQRLSALNPSSEFQRAVQGEVLGMIDLCDQFRAFLAGQSSTLDRDFAAMDGPEGFLVSGLRLVYPTGWLYQDKVWLYRFYQRHAVPSAKPRPGMLTKPEWRSELRSAADPCLLVYVVPRLVHVLDDGVKKGLFLQSAINLTATACAVERYRLAKGKPPESLETLVPAYLTGVLNDPPAGPDAKLKYRPSDDGGFILWSIGSDRVDDGGQPSPAYLDWRGDQALFPRLEQGDWVWKVPPPK